MHHTSKADLLECLEAIVSNTESSPKVDVKVIDVAALVHMLDPNKSVTPVKTFKEYSLFVFVPYIIHKLKEIARIDVVWDIYKEDSLKIQTRHDREGVLIYVLI